QRQEQRLRYRQRGLGGHRVADADAAGEHGKPGDEQGGRRQASLEGGSVAAVNSQAMSTRGTSDRTMKASPLSSRPISLGEGPTGRVRRELSQGRAPSSATPTP